VNRRRRGGGEEEERRRRSAGERNAGNLAELMSVDAATLAVALGTTRTGQRCL